jgi:ribose-phosphate pyrophosphokinase
MVNSILFCLDGREYLANDIISFVNDYTPSTSLQENRIELGSLRNQKFSDGELCVDFIDSVRGKRIYILSSPNTSDEIIKLNLAIDAAKRGAAKEIIAVIPYFPYTRQDKKDQSRGPIGAKVVAEMIEHRGATSVITYDLHADQIQGFFNIPVTHIEGKNVFDDYIYLLLNDSSNDIILCGPDAGSGKRVKRMKDQIYNRYGVNINYIMLDKTRKEANVVDEMVIIGDVTNKDVIILDDIVDTAGTLCKAAEVLINSGAKSVRAIISHGVLSGPAYNRIDASMLTELIISDSLESMVHEKIIVASVAKQIGIAIAASNTGLSYEGLRTSNKIIS